MIESDPKTQAGRRPALALPELAHGHVRRRAGRPRLTAGDPDAAFVFVSPEGGPPALLQLAHPGLAAGPGGRWLAVLNFHDLKHTAGTALLDEGINIKTAQARLGHANPRTTLAFYAQATVQADREASDRLGERFRPRDGRGMVPRPRKSRRGPHPL